MQLLTLLTTRLSEKDKDGGEMVRRGSGENGCYENINLAFTEVFTINDRSIVRHNLCLPLVRGFHWP